MKSYHLWLVLLLSFHRACGLPPTRISSPTCTPSATTRLFEAYDGNDSGRRSIIPAGEEALHSAMMARTIRKMRDNRGLMKKTTNEQDEDEVILGRTRSNLLLTTTEFAISRRKKIKRDKLGWKNANAPLFTTSSIQSNSKSTFPVKAKSTSTTVKPKRSNGIDLPYPCTIQALRVYYSKHGDLTMPRRYAVPHEAEYPREWHGVDLAGTVYDMKWWQKHVKQKPERVEELNRMGFLWERLQPEWNLVLEALIYYAELNGDLMIPGTFVVPHGDNRWPKATWGIPLGNCVYRIRHRFDFLRGNTAESRRDQLDGLGFVWNVQEHRFQLFYRALQHFALIQKHMSSSAIPSRNTALRVPCTFVVPQTNSWPEDLWGYPLGAKCTAVRQKQLYVKGNPRRQQLLESLNFQWNGNASLGWLRVMHAAAIYSKLHNRQLDVPYDFKVPHPPRDLDPKMRVDIAAAGDNNEVWPWPEYLWGLPLGQRLKDVRQKGAYLKGKNGEARRRQLVALGFNWNPKRGRPPKKDHT